MSGQTARCRSRYSSRRSRLIRSTKQTRSIRRTRGPTGPRPRRGPVVPCWRSAPRIGRLGVTHRPLEVVVVDVVLVELGRRAEDNLALGSDRSLSEVTCLEGLTLLAADRSVGEGGGRVVRQVPELLRVPEGELGDGAVLDVLPHVVGRAEPGQLDLTGLAGGLERAGCRGDAHRGRRDDPLQVGESLEQALSLLEGLRVVIVPV